MTTSPMPKKVTRPGAPERRGKPGATAAGAHFALVIALTVALAAILCYISTRQFVRMDWRSTAQQPLTDDTRALLARVSENVEATIIHRTLSFPDDKKWMRTMEMAEQVLAQFSAANPRIVVDELNWSLPEDQVRLNRLVTDPNDRKNLPEMCVLFTSARGHMVVSFDALVYQAGGPLGRPEAFLGESAFASAVAGVTGLQALAPEPGAGARRMRFFDLPEAHVTVARYVFMGGLPACFVVLGVLVWIVRRR